MKMVRLNFYSVIAIFSLLLFASCEKEESLPERVEDYGAISQTEFEQKVCGYCWVLNSTLATYTDNNPNAIPFFEDEYLDYMKRCFFFEKEKLTSYIGLGTSSPVNTFREDKIKFNATNGCVLLADGSNVMKIYYVDDSNMKVIEGTKVSDGIHYYKSHVYTKMSDSDFEYRKKYSKPHAAYYKYFDMTDEMPVHCEPSEIMDGIRRHYISRDDFEEQLVGSKWCSYHLDRNGKYMGEYHEILSDGILRTKTYPYGYEFGTRIDTIAFPSSSTVTITEREYGSKTGTTTKTYAFRYESNSEHPGLNDVIYMDSNKVEHRIRIVNHAFDYGSEQYPAFRAIVENDGRYCYACFDRCK